MNAPVSFDAINQFKAAMAQAEIMTDDPIYADGVLHRFHVEGDKRGTKNGWYVLYLDAVAAGAFGSWKLGIARPWCAKVRHAMSAGERKAFRQKMAKSSRLRDAEQQKIHAQASLKAQQIWAKAKQADPHHPYLVRKGIQSYGIRQSGASLIIPLMRAGVIHSLQFISPTGEKKFLLGGAIKGGYLMLGTPDGLIQVGTGYATGASLHAATEQCTVVAFSDQNLSAVVQALRDLFPNHSLLICGDNDQFTPGNPGATKARAVAAAFYVPVAIPEFQELDSRPTDFNDLARLQGLDAVKASLEKAMTSFLGNRADEAVNNEFRWQDFRLEKDGLYYHGTDRNGEPLRRWICDPLRITAQTRDNNSDNWGRYLEWQDKDGKPHQWAMPMELLAGTGEEFRRELLRQGLSISVSARDRNLLTEYIQRADAKQYALCVDRIGWHARAFVLPNRTIGKSNDRIIYQSPAGAINAFKHQGTLAGWQREVAALCIGNSRLVLAVSLAFAAPLLYLTDVEPGGFNIQGGSSIGKSTALATAASVYGGRDFVLTWRTTDNATESTAVSRNDILMILDEMGQVDPNKIGEIAYMLANGAGKTRLTKSIVNRPTLTWRTMILSSGETSLAAHMAEGGRRVKAGQEVRLVDLPADAGAGYGLFENLHDFPDGDAFAKEITSRARNYYGTAGIAFIEKLAEQDKTLPGHLKQQIQDLKQEMLPKEASSQAMRIATRCALAGVAGELATHYGITGWSAGRASKAAIACFNAILDARGGSGDQETLALLTQVRTYFEKHGESRFSPMDTDPDRPTHNRAGFRRSDSLGNTEYLVLPEAFRTEVCAGMDAKSAARILVQKGWLTPDKEGKSSQTLRLPMSNKPSRCYVFSARMWED